MRNLTWALLACLAMWLPAQSWGATAHEPRFTLRQGASLTDAVVALASGVHVVIADTSAVDSRLQKPLEDAPQKAALDAISVDFDRYVIRRGDAWVLQRRFSEPREEPELEMEEVKQAATDLYRLVEPFAPRIKGVQFIFSKEDFLKSLTPDQVAALTSKGIPISALPERQRQAWTDINNYHVFDHTVRELRRAALCLERWGNVPVQAVPVENFRVGQLWLKIPDPSGEEDGVDVGIPWLNVRSATPKPDGIELPVLAGRERSDFRDEWSFAAHETDLGTLVRDLAQSGGPQVRIPAYARQRRVLIASNGGKRGEILRALGDLWGWELTPVKEGYRLDRPAISPAKDVIDLHEKLSRAIPPALRHQMKLVEAHCTARWAAQMQLILADTQRVGGDDWKSVQVAQLRAEIQRRLAITVAYLQFDRALDDWLKRGTVPGWMSRPNEGVLRLSGPLAPGAHPLMAIYVPAGTGKYDMWGWVIGTSSLHKK